VWAVYFPTRVPFGVTCMLELPGSIRHDLQAEPGKSFTHIPIAKFLQQAMFFMLGNRVDSRPRAKLIRCDEILCDIYKRHALSSLLHARLA